MQGYQYVMDVLPIICFSAWKVLPAIGNNGLVDNPQGSADTQHDLLSRQSREIPEPLQ